MAKEEKGEIIRQMVRDVEQELPKRVAEVHKKSGLLEFWLLFTMKEDKFNPKVIRQGWVACPIPPLNIEGTLVFHVDIAKDIIEVERINRRVLTGFGQELQRMAKMPINYRAKI